MQREPRTLADYLAATSGLGAPWPPAVTELADRAGLAPAAASNIFTLELCWWDFRLQTIPYAQDLSPIERSFFDQFIRVSYGTQGSAATLIYETFLRPTGHPEAIRYIDNVLAQPA